MTGMIINSFLYGFGLSAVVYFTGYTVPLITSLARWK